MQRTVIIRIIPILTLILSAVDLERHTNIYRGLLFRTGNVICVKAGKQTAKMPDSILCENNILQISGRNLQDRAPNANRARLKFDTEIESLVGTRRVSGLKLRRAGRTFILTQKLPAQRRSPSETFPQDRHRRRKDKNGKQKAQSFNLPETDR